MTFYRKRQGYRNRNRSLLGVGYVSTSEGQLRWVYWWGDGTVLYVDYSGSYIKLCISKFIELYAKERWILRYIHKTKKQKWTDGLDPTSSEMWTCFERGNKSHLNPINIYWWATIMQSSMENCKGNIQWCSRLVNMHKTL